MARQDLGIRKQPPAGMVRENAFRPHFRQYGRLNLDQGRGHDEAKLPPKTEHFERVMIP
jgi:hypothetical protein